MEKKKFNKVKSDNTALNILCEKLVASLNEEKIPWERPWDITKSHVSHSTGHQYSFLNCLFLDVPGEYITPAAAIKLGIKVKDIEQHYAFGSFPKMITCHEKNDKGVMEEHTKCIGRAVKYFKLINVNDIHLEPKYFGKDHKDHGVKANDKIEELETAIKSYCDREGVVIHEEEGQNRAFFALYSRDISIKRRDYFQSINAFYGVLFHELIHSTGTKDRLDRFDKFETHDYDREELVAEIGSAILRNHFGIENKKLERNTEAYVQGWARALRDDPNIIVWAMTRAESAVKFFLTGEKYTKEDTKAEA